MKKVLMVVVAVAFALTAFAAMAEEQVKKETIKVQTSATETKAVVKEKTPGVKEKETIVVKPEEKKVDVVDVTKSKKGDVWKDTVKFEKLEENGDYIYVTKEDKVIRLKHKLSDGDKKEMLKKKKGDAITVTSTYPLTQNELAVVLEAK